MLEIKNLLVETNGREILKNLSLTINQGEVMILFGPNGSGKSTLIKTIMGFQEYNIKKGEIKFKGQKLNDWPVEKRVKLGLGVMFQHPPKIRGVKLGQIAEFLGKNSSKTAELAKTLSLEEHLKRELNVNFSGGEMKRSELFQIILQNPDLLLLDEPESGVDLENISLMGRVLNDYLKKEGKAALIITHTGYILDYVAAKRGCVLIDGEFWCAGEPKEMFETIRRKGYEKCKICQNPQTS